MNGPTLELITPYHILRLIVLKKKLSDLKANKAVGPFYPYTKIIKLFSKYSPSRLTPYLTSPLHIGYSQIYDRYPRCAEYLKASSLNLLRPIAFTSTLSKIHTPPSGFMSMLRIKLVNFSLVVCLMNE